MGVTVHFQLEFHLAALMARLELEDRSLADELGLNVAQIARFRSDRWSTMKRADLQTVLCWGKRHGVDLLTIEPSPIWRTFPNSEVVMYRGRDSGTNPLASDSRAEAELVEAFTVQGCRVIPRLVSEPNSEEIIESMRTKNCVFIGSPKHNQATEIALAALWRLEPFGGTSENRSKAPVAFVWEPAQARSTFSEPRQPDVKLGIYMSVTGVKNERSRYHVPVDWRPSREYVKWIGRGRDAGLLVLCNRPLGTEQDVTTVVLAGYSGFATVDMATDFARNGLRIESADVRPGASVVRVLSALYRKTSARGDSRQRVLKGRRWFSPPWSQLKELSKRK
jgi:hypothetical protein